MVKDIDGNLIVKSCHIPCDADYLSVDQKRFMIEHEVLNLIEKHKIKGLKYVTTLSGEFRDGDQYFLFTPYYEGSTLSDLIDQLTTDRLIKITRQVIEGIAAYEKLKINHRDLHTKNIIIGKNDRVHIIDFDLAYYPNTKYNLEDEMVNNFTGEYVYDYFSESSDIYLYITSLSYESEKHENIKDFINSFRIWFQNMQRKHKSTKKILEEFSNFRV